MPCSSLPPVEVETAPPPPPRLLTQYTVGRVCESKSGPTNSGKTYNAINRLKQAGAERKTGDKPVGLFCGPLRLLALEIYEQVCPVPWH